MLSLPIPFVWCVCVWALIPDNYMGSKTIISIVRLINPLLLVSPSQDEDLNLILSHPPIFQCLEQWIFGGMNDHYCTEYCLRSLIV